MSQEPEQESCGVHHHAGCTCHEQGWRNKWQAAINDAANARIERDDALRRIELAAKYLRHHHLSRPGIAAIVAILTNKETP